MAFSLVVYSLPGSTAEVHAAALSPGACAGVALSPEQNIAVVASKLPSHATLCLTKGLYRLDRPIRPKEGQRFIAVGRVTVDGGGAPISAFEGHEDDVLVRGLRIRNFATPARFGVLHFAEATGWRVIENRIGNNGGIGIFSGDRSAVLRNLVHHQGQLGLAGGGRGSLVQGNEIAFNNTGGYDWYWEAGGAKFVHTTRLTVRRNYVHDNVGPGLWTDLDNIGTLYEGNRVIGNVGPGIFHELSFRAIIRKNIVRENAIGVRLWWGGAGILVSGSRDVSVFSNRVSGNSGGIGMIQPTRGASPKFGYEYLLQNVHVFDNVIEMTSGVSGAVSNNGPAAFLSRSNRFSNNHWRLDGLNGQFFQWMDRSVAKEGWVSYGHDVEGTFEEI